MIDTSLKADWQKLIDVASRADIESGESPSLPATDEEIDSLRQRAAQNGLKLDEDFVTFLRYTNGFGFNGLTIPGAELDPGYHDFVSYNVRQSSIIDVGPVYGNLDDTYYVLYPDGKFRRLSAGDPDYVLSTHDTFFGMATEALAMAVGPAVRDDDPAADAEIFKTPSTAA